MQARDSSSSAHQPAVGGDTRRLPSSALGACSFRGGHALPARGFGPPATEQVWACSRSGGGPITAAADQDRQTARLSGAQAPDRIARALAGVLDGWATRLSSMLACVLAHLHSKHLPTKKAAARCGLLAVPALSGQGLLRGGLPSTRRLRRHRLCRQPWCPWRSSRAGRPCRPIGARRPRG